MNFYSLIEKVFALERAGRRIIKLNLGETNLPLPVVAREAAERCLRDHACSYGPAAGLPELRERIAQRENCRPEQVVVGPGSKQLIYGVLHVLGVPGRRVVLPAPTWPAYALMCRDLGLEATVVPASIDQNWNFGTLSLERAAAVVLCNPLNPCSTCYDPANVAQLMEQAAGQAVPVVVDEAYRGLCFGTPPALPVGVLRVRSFSKEFCMEGWRVGYALLPEALAARLTAFNQLTITCVPEFVQRAAIACLDHEQEILPALIQLWRARSQAAFDQLHLAGFTLIRPQAGIYVFCTHPGIKDGMDFADKLLERGVAVAPGEAFGPYPGYIRICLNQPLDPLTDALSKVTGLATQRC